MTLTIDGMQQTALIIALDGLLAARAAWLKNDLASQRETAIETRKRMGAAQRKMLPTFAESMAQRAQELDGVANLFEQLGHANGAATARELAKAFLAEAK